MAGVNQELRLEIYLIKHDQISDSYTVKLLMLENLSTNLLSPVMSYEHQKTDLISKHWSSKKSCPAVQC